MAKPISLTMPLESAMRTQRAIRRLKPDPVDDALVLHLIELGETASLLSACPTIDHGPGAGR